MAINRPVTKTLISTTGWGIPITDEVNALRTAVTALQTPGPWTTMTLQNGWTHFASSPMQYRKFGDMVQLRGRIENAAGNAFIVVSNLPVGFRPPKDCMMPIAVVISGSWSTSSFQLASNGDVAIMIQCQSTAPLGAFSITP